MSSDSDVDEGATAQKRTQQDDAKWIGGEFSPSVFPFNATYSGQVCSSALPPDPREVDNFKLFFDEGLVSLVVTETSKQTDKKVQERSLPRKSCLRPWCRALLLSSGCEFLMGLVWKNTLRENWFKDTMTETSFFRSIFSANCFCLLMRVLHFSFITDGNDRLRTIRPIMEAVQEKFSTFLAPFENLCIDDSLVPWRGCLSIKIFLPRGISLESRCLFFVTFVPATS